MEWSVFFSSIDFFASLRAHTRKVKKLIKQTKNAPFHARCGNERLEVPISAHFSCMPLSVIAVATVGNVKSDLQGQIWSNWAQTQTKVFCYLLKDAL